MEFKDLDLTEIKLDIFEKSLIILPISSTKDFKDNDILLDPFLSHDEILELENNIKNKTLDGKALYINGFQYMFIIVYEHSDFINTLFHELMHILQFLQKDLSLDNHTMCYLNGYITKQITEWLTIQF